LCAGTQDESREITIHETKASTARKRARRGAVITGVRGLIDPPRLIGAVLGGGAVGAPAGRARDTGDKHPQLQEMAERLGPGRAAIIALADDAAAARAQNALGRYEGRLIIRALEEETPTALSLAAGRAD
jgi:uncharacterized membrane protein